MIKLSDHFTYKKIIQFCLPTISMMIFTSIYCVVDGFFVSNFAGQTEFDALNFIIPLILILGSIGFMFGSGSSALIGKRLGEGKKEEANSIFTFIIATAILISIVLAILGFIFIRPIAITIGAEEYLLDDAVRYGRILLIALPFYVLQFCFQCLFATSEKPKLGLYVTLLAGCTNMILDALFVGIFKWGLVGAGFATGLSQFIGAFIPLIYFALPNKSLLRFTKFKVDFKSLFVVCLNGSSELISNISMSVVAMLYNFQLLKYENGLTAYGVLMYVSMIFHSIFFGLAGGTAPIISFNFGAKNKEELKNVLKKTVVILTISAITMLVCGELLARPIGVIFFKEDPIVVELIVHAFRIFSISFLFTGFTVYTSSFFTALNNGVISMCVSSLRTIVFYVICILVIPIFFQLDGIWFSIVVAEFLGFIASFIFIISNKKKYQY